MAAALEDTMDAARRLARTLAADTGDAIDSIYIAGSLTAGLGNSTSDADLFVLRRPDARPDDAIRQYNIGGRRVDVESYSLDQVEATINDVTSFEVCRDRLTDIHQLPSKLDFVIRFHLSEPVVGSPALDRLRGHVAASIATVRQAALNYLSIAVNGHLEDFFGASAEGDFDTAAVVGQELMSYAGKAVAAASGDLYFGRKWVYKQLRRSAIGAFPLDRFAEFQRGGWTRGGVEAAGQLIFFGQSCLAVSHLLGTSGIPLDVWPSWTPGSSPDGLWRSAAYCVLRPRDGVLLHWELHRQLLLREHVAIVWALCDGHGPDEIAANVERLNDAFPVLKSLSVKRINGILTSLRERGLVLSAPFGVLDAV